MFPALLHFLTLRRVMRIKKQIPEMHFDDRDCMHDARSHMIKLEDYIQPFSL